MTAKHRAAFTLVELLVVIAIIGLLTALVVPAVQAARERARQGFCLNNIRNIGLAMVSHATNKTTFPGRVNLVKRSGNSYGIASWVAKTLPEMDNTALWDTFLTQPNFAFQTGSYVGLMVCPSDVQANKEMPWLSYGANCGVWDVWQMKNAVGQYADLRMGGVCLDEIRNPLTPGMPRNVNFGLSKSSDPGYLSAHDGTSNTILLAENANLTHWGVAFSDTIDFQRTTGVANQFLIADLNRDENNFSGLKEGLGVVWSIQPQLPFGRSETDNLIDAELPTYAGTPRSARPASFHRGLFMTAFTDGHARSLSTELDPAVYAKLLAGHDQGIVQKTTLGTQVPAAFGLPISESALK